MTPTHEHTKQENLTFISVPTPDAVKRNCQNVMSDKYVRARESLFDDIYIYIYIYMRERERREREREMRESVCVCV